MSQSGDAWYEDVLACPDCQGALLSREGGLACNSCGFFTDEVIDGARVIKPSNPVPLRLSFPRTIDQHPTDLLESIELSRPKVTYKGPSAIRDSRELMSELQRFLKDGAKVLDLGCGPRDQAVPIEHLGYQYVGIDYSNDKADILADAHAVPFKSETFDCVLSYAVLEHLHNPFVAIHEVERVLKEGGVYIGTVSQGEPFHGSYFHHTSWGFISLLSSTTSLKIKRLWWTGDTLDSLSQMGRYPRVIKWLIKSVDRIHRLLPCLSPRKMRWPEHEKFLDKLHRAGGICFVVQKQSRKNIK